MPLVPATFQFPVAGLQQTPIRECVRTSHYSPTRGIAGAYMKRGVDMKKLLLTGVALTALFSGSAIAADVRMAPSYQSYQAPPPVFSWTGCYVGGHVGYGKSSYDQQIQFDDTNTA